LSEAAEPSNGDLAAQVLPLPTPAAT